MGNNSRCNGSKILRKRRRGKKEKEYAVLNVSLDYTLGGEGNEVQK
jgi:hypothetical protein